MWFGRCTFQSPCVSVDRRDRAVWFSRPSASKIWGSFIHSAIIKWYGSRDRPSTVGMGHEGLQREMQLNLMDLQIFEVYFWCHYFGSFYLNPWDHDRPWYFNKFPNSAARKICPMPQNYAHNVLTLLWKQFTEWGSKSACRSSFDGQILLCRWCQRQPPSFAGKIAMTLW